MLSAKSDNTGKILFFLISVAFIAINSVLIANEFFYFSLIPLAIILFLMAIFSIDRFILLIVFLVPLSVPLTRILGKMESDFYLPTEPLLALVVLLFFLNILRGSRLDSRVLRHPVSIAIYFNIAWIFITAMTSSMPMVSFKFLASRLWFVIPFFFIATRIFESGKRMRTYIWAFIIPFTLVIIYINIKLASHGMTNQHAANFVVDPFFADHTSYGAIIAMLIPALTGLFLTQNKNHPGLKFLFILLIAFYIAALVFSYTRAAWLSLILTFFIWVIIRLRIRWQILLFAAIIIAGFAYGLRNEILMKAEQNKQISSGKISEHLRSVGNIRNDVSNLERLNRWNCAVRMFKERPFFGWGPGTYMFKYAPFQVSGEKTEISTNAGIKGNAHSEYLGPLAEQGVFGLLSMLAVVITSVWTGLKVFFNRGNRRTRVLVMAVLLGLITYYIHGVMNNFLDTDKASALFWGFTAMLVAADLYHSGKNLTAKQARE